MTGGTSGFGVHAARRLAAACGTLVLATHRAPAITGAVGVPVDLASLADVRVFADTVIAHAEGRGIDGLVLNAGRSFALGRTADGFERNFAVNHLAHYLLLRLLLPHLAPGARVVLTTSATHDPAAGTMIPPPLHADAGRLARPDTDPDRDADAGKAAGRAYAASKLCNLLTARALAAGAEAATKDLHVIAYSPGPVPGTGLLGDRGGLLNFVWRRVAPLLRFAAPGLNAPRLAGGTLADLALGITALPAGRVYALLERGKLVFPDPSELAQRDDVMDRMWCDSAALAGLDRPAAAAAEATG
jgi:NAD(P)-dependent dehydrogenase (short-subunit alcohol dehydrogenase family)